MPEPDDQIQAGMEEPMEEPIKKPKETSKPKKGKQSYEKVKDMIEKEEANLDEVEKLEEEEGKMLKEMESELEKDEKLLEEEEKKEEEVKDALDKELEDAEAASPNLEKVRQAKAPILKGAQTQEEEQPAEQSSSIKIKEKKEDQEEKKAEMTTHIYGLRTTANREDQVMSFISSNVQRKKIPVYAVIRPHGMRGYIFLESETMGDAEAAAFGVPYARGILPKEILYHEIEHMLERVKKEINIQKNDIAEIISGPFKREKCKITRIDKTKEEVVVELLEAAVPIPITVKMDAVKVIRRDTPDSDE
ncbi:MAG: transcription elongation factor Spt5 [Nanoarchaeota archaeon]